MLKGVKLNTKSLRPFLNFDNLIPVKINQINMKLGKYIVGLISGLTFGMLFAPRKGKDLRNELVKKSSESGAEGLKVLGNAFKDAGEDAFKELKGLSEHEQITAFLELSQEKMKNFLEAAEEKGYDVASAVQEKFEDLAKMAKGKMNEMKKKTSEIEKKVINTVDAKKNNAFAKRKVALKKPSGKKVKKTKKTTSAKK